MLNLKDVFQTLDAYDAAAREPASSRTHILDRFGKTAERRFRNEFEVVRFSYRRAGARIPSDLVRLSELSERWLPAPRGHQVSASGELGNSDDVLIETSKATIRRLDFPFPAHASIASGQMAERSGATRRFLAAAAPNGKEFKIEILGSITSETGIVHALHFAGDGGVLPAGLSPGGFVAEMDGSIFRLHATATTGASIDEAGFNSLNRVKLSIADDQVSIWLAGQLNIGETACDCDVVILGAAGRVGVKITEAGSGLLFFAGSAPAERVTINVYGALDDKTPYDGNIIILDRDDGTEIRRFPLEGRVTGLTWDGFFLLQAVWPANLLLKIDPREGGGVVERIAVDVPGHIAGVAFDSGVVVAGVCSQNIMRSQGGTSLQVIEPSSGRTLRSIPRPHAVSSGITAAPEGFIGSVNGSDHTPISSDSALVIMDKATGNILETIIFPRNFFIEDVQRDGDGTVLISVTEGLSAIGKNGSLWEMKIHDK